jgi:vacuolar-type H+-ATPase subunit H
MAQATIARVLSIEQDATRIRNDALAEAAQMVADFEREASGTRERVLAEARLQAAQIEREGRRAAKSERSEAIAQAEADAERMEQLAGENFADAVRLILDKVAGRT